MRRRGRSRDGERMDQYRAIHAEVISLSTVSGGSRVAWRRGVARCWRGVAWCGVRARWASHARSVSLPHPLFLPLYSLSPSFFSVSPRLPLSLSFSRHPSLPAAFLSRFSASAALDRPAGPLLRGVKIEPLWRSSDSRTSLLAVLITLRNQC